MKTLLLAMLFASTLCFSRTLQVTLAPQDIALPSAVQIFCEVSYKPQLCQDHARTLAVHLQKLPLNRVPGWKFVLVPSNAWPSLMTQIQGLADSPAFSALTVKTIVLEEALFAPSILRQEALMRSFYSHGEALIDIALSHELGHAICMDKDEVRADEFGKQLRAGNSPVCHKRR